MPILSGKGGRTPTLTSARSSSAAHPVWGGFSETKQTDGLAGMALASEMGFVCLTNHLPFPVWVDTPSRHGPAFFVCSFWQRLQKAPNVFVLFIVIVVAAAFLWTMEGRHKHHPSAYPVNPVAKKKGRGGTTLEGRFLSAPL